MRIINKLERVAWLRYIFVVMTTATRMSWERESTWFDFRFVQNLDTRVAGHYDCGIDCVGSFQIGLLGI